ncbi:cysteine-rich venom protein TEL1-like isoform X2 [Wyeomyia smithii]|uniref:cysteine-rich venom protein TEL1-like isoform X2 n=1 Tax=Wyeomyia smithii TaxID=174621 RepID=UPI002467FE45|nr:cysteine-rich venom protein TEL1-like isoform X2 [Wyeomyia smithii]
MVKIICLLALLALSVDLAFSWRFDRLPRLYGDRLSMKAISPRTRKVQRRIVVLHNFFRTKVAPPASNMLSMRWHHVAARSAQKWADQCRLLTHDTPKGRWIDSYGACGQNIFVSTHKVPWLFALRTWFLERQNFTYGSHKNDLVAVGHYTQMVWAASHKVGCGLAKCARGGPTGKPYFNYVCNYCPICYRVVPAEITKTSWVFPIGVANLAARASSNANRKKSGYVPTLVIRRICGRTVGSYTKLGLVGFVTR